MKVIGYKKKGLIPVYLIVVALGILFIVMSILSEVEKNYEKILFLLTGITFIILGLAFVISIIKTPYEAIKYNYNNKSLIVSNKVVYLREIIDVSYKTARGKYNIQYKFGDVIIKTINGKVKGKYINECEKVAKEIYEIIKINKEDEIKF